MTSADDRQVVEAQVGRPLRAESVPVSLCHLGLPVVVRVPPILDDGTPFPTLYWLTCPLASTRVARLESSGGVKRMEQKAETDPDFGRRLEESHASYAAERDSLLPPGASPIPSGGVGGVAAGVKCLHAAYAHTRAGGANPVGELVQEWIEPLDCAIPCVVGGERNPSWSPNP
ncbi:MAG TPA: DUF501 domain-containing protein [Acidimicrobiia bacterium]